MIKFTHFCVLSTLTIGYSQAAFAENEGTIHLDEVSVTEKQIDEAYYAPIANSATKTDTPLMETPVSIQVIDESVLRDQNAQKIGDAVRNVSGVQAQHFFGGTSERFLMRGFLQSTVGFRNGARVPLKKFDLANVERVEVLKGPASMLYGPGDPSGMINVVTKKPQKEAHYSIEQTIGMFDTYRTEVSATGAIDDEGMLTYRLDAAWQEAGSYRELIETERYFISPSLSFKPNANTEFNLNIEPQRDRGVYDVGQPAVGKHLADLPRKRSFGQNDVETYKSVLIDFNAAHTFDSGWKLSGGVFDSKQRNDLLDIYMFGRLQEGDTDISRNFWKAKEKIDSRTTYLNLAGKLETGGIEHSLLAGLERISLSYKQKTRDRFIDNVNIYTFRPGNYIDPTPFMTGDIDVFSDHQTRANGFYVQDQIKLNSQWQILAGARYDRISQNLGAFYYSPLLEVSRTDGATSPRIGVVYQPQQNISLFGNCAKSFGVAFNYEAGDLYEPETAKQCEAGVKTEWLGGKLMTSLVAYHLTKENIPTADPNLPGRTVAIGEAVSKGLEFDMQGQLTDHLSMIGSLAFTETEITKAGDGTEGNRLPYAPRYQYSLALNYDFNGDPKDGLSLGGALFGTGQRYGDAENSYGDNRYAKLDLYGAYRFKLNSTKMTAQLNINNVTNEKFYYLRTFWTNLPSEPTSVQATLRADF